MSFVSQRNHGIYIHRAARWDVTCCYRSKAHHRGYGDECHRVRRPDPVQKAADELREQGSTGQTAGKPHERNPHALVKHKHEYVVRLRAERQAQSDFRSSLRGDVSNHTVDSHEGESEGQSRERADQIETKPWHHYRLQKYVLIVH